MILGDLTLPDDLIWTDEINDSTPIVEARNYSIGGVLIIDTAEKQAGRPITLEGGDGCVITRAELLALLALRDSNPASMTLTLADARTFSVRFDYSATAVSAEPVFRRTYPDNSDPYWNITIRLLEVTA